ncbi:MAG: helicase, partial [Nitrospinales bacterium]|nr:helicase [Nitrospinales bacterium]
MPKLNKFRIQIQTGSEGIEEPARFCFNSHVLPLEELSGGTKAGEILEGGYAVSSLDHSMTLVGPEKGTCSIQKIKV